MCDVCTYIWQKLNGFHMKFIQIEFEYGSKNVNGFWVTVENCAKVFYFPGKEKDWKNL